MKQTQHRQSPTMPNRRPSRMTVAKADGHRRPIRIGIFTDFRRLGIDSQRFSMIFVDLETIFTDFAKPTA